LEPGEDLGIEILADVEGGSVDGLRPELLLVRPEFGLRLDGGLERVRRREVGLDAGVDAEAEGIVGLADLPLHAAARHRRCCCFSLVPPLLLVSFFAGKKGLGIAPWSLGLIYSSCF